MPASKPEHPTELELEILKILWNESPLSVREVRKRLKSEAGRPLAHTTVITVLNIMHRKGFVLRQEQGNAFLFSPRQPKEVVAGKMMGDLLSRVFEGSPTAMMLNLLETADLDVNELVELRRMISHKVKEQQK